jgi:hypothetical protein
MWYFFSLALIISLLDRVDSHIYMFSLKPDTDGYFDSNTVNLSTQIIFEDV